MMNHSQWPQFDFTHRPDARLSSTDADLSSDKRHRRKKLNVVVREVVDRSTVEQKQEDLSMMTPPIDDTCWRLVIDQEQPPTPIDQQEPPSPIDQQQPSSPTSSLDIDNFTQSQSPQLSPNIQFNQTPTPIRKSKTIDNDDDGLMLMETIDNDDHNRSIIEKKVRRRLLMDGLADKLDQHMRKSKSSRLFWRHEQRRSSMIAERGRVIESDRGVGLVCFKCQNDHDGSRWDVLMPEHWLSSSSFDPHHVHLFDPIVQILPSASIPTRLILCPSHIQLT
jgi:hypothetical protein